MHVGGKTPMDASDYPFKNTAGTSNLSGKAIRTPMTKGIVASRGGVAADLPYVK